MPAEIPDGAVIVARAIVNSSLWTMRDADRILALTCIVKANWKDRRWFDGRKSITIKRGQFVTGRRQLARDANLSEQVTRTSLSRLEKCGFLTREVTRDYTLISLPKYDLYQNLSKYEAVPNPATNPQPTQPQPNPNPTLTTTKKVKKDKKEKKSKSERTPLQKAKQVAAVYERVAVSPGRLPYEKAMFQIRDAIEHRGVSDTELIEYLSVYGKAQSLEKIISEIVENNAFLLTPQARGEK